MRKPLDPMSVERTETPSASYVLRRRYGPARHVIAVASWVTVISMLLQPVAVLAATYTWEGDTSATWATAANWSTAIPTINDTANFSLVGPYSNSGVPYNPNASGGAIVPMSGITIGSGNGAMEITTGTEFRIGNGGITIAAGAGATTFGPERVESRLGAIPLVNDSASLLTVAGVGPASAYNGNITLTISGNGSGGTTVNGPIANGGSYTVTVTVAAPNSITTFASGVTHTYIGTTTVNSGTLLVNGTLNTQTDAVTVNSGGTLGGTGTINRPVTVASGGTLHPGGSIGKLTVGADISHATASIFAWQAKHYTTESDIGTAGTDYSQVAMTAGKFTLASGTLGKLYFPAGEDFSGSFWNTTRTWDIITGGSSSSSGPIDDGNISVYVNSALYDGGDREITGQGAFSIAYFADGILRLTWTAASGGGTVIMFR